MNGKPLAAAKISFHFGDEFVGTRLKDDGRYTVSRLAPGKYKVTIEAKVLPERYSSEDKTELIVEVGQGPNVFNFDLSL